jgi:hypothetical protein
MGSGHTAHATREGAASAPPGRLEALPVPAAIQRAGDDAEGGERPHRPAPYKGSSVK